MWNPVRIVMENWEVESYPKLWELRYTLCFACFFPAVRFFLDTFIFENVGRHFLFRNARNIARAQQAKKAALSSSAGSVAGDGGVKEPLLGKKAEASAMNGHGHGKNGVSGVLANGNGNHAQGAAVASVEDIDREALEKTLVKFKESCWKCLYYSSALCLSLLAIWGEPYLTDNRFFFKGPGDNVWPDLTMKLKLKTIFWYEGGFYLYSIFALIFWETRRKDFVVSMVHHVVSAALTAGAFVVGFGRPGAVVVAIHDTSDIFLEMAKVNRYLNHELAASIFFISFALSWAILRLYCYPKYIITASSFVCFQVLRKEDHVDDGPTMYYSFNFVLLLLLVLHIYWWILIVRVLAKQLSSGKVDKDVRSEDEDEDDD